MIKHREENRPQVHAVDHGADEYSDQRRRLQPPQRRDHAEGEERGENEQRKEHVQPAARERPAEPPAQRAQGVEHQRERRAEKERREQRPRLLGNRQAHPKSRAKKPPPGAGSSA